MTCNDVREALAALDRDRQIPVSLDTHLRACPECNRLAQAMVAAEETVVLSRSSDSAADARMADAVMGRIAAVSLATSPRGEGWTSLGAWISGAFLLSGALVSVRFSAPFQYLAQSPVGRTVDLWVTLSLSTLLAGYLCVFAGRNVVQAAISVDEDMRDAEAE